jgi:putative SOS response-associated peptidase YedK
MIDRYELTSSALDIARLFCGHANAIQIDGPREVTPPQDAPVLRLEEGGQRRLSLLRWGLVPAWAPDLSFGKVCVNARAETATTKPAFRRALRQRRCLIPADAFRMTRIENGKVRTGRAERAQGGPFALAGLWESWTSPAGDAVETFTVITAGATAIRPHGMPVAIEQRNHALWLDPAPAQFDRQVRLMKPVSDQMLRIRDDEEDLRRFDAARQQCAELRQLSGAIRKEAAAEARAARAHVRDIGVESTQMRMVIQRLHATLGENHKETV